LNQTFTTAIFSNISSFGPKATTSSSCSSFYQAAINVKKNTKLQVYNSVLAGWVNGIKVESENTKANMVNNDIKVRNTVISGIATGSEFTLSSVTTWTATDMATWFNTTTSKNSINADNATLLVVDPFNLTAPKFNLTAGSSLNSGSYWNVSTGIFTPKSTSANSLKIYPNPAKSELNVVLPFENNDKVAISIVDVTGREVYNQISTGIVNEVIDIKGLNNGVYMIKAKQANVQFTQKLFVSK